VITKRSINGRNVMLVHNLPFYSVVFASPKMLFVEITICRATVYTGESLEGKIITYGRQKMGDIQ
jgi:hypothetical protein